jgi:hypothetical protein
MRSSRLAASVNLADPQNAEGRSQDSLLGVAAEANETPYRP